MNMLDQIHKWFEQRKPCKELDDRQLERKIRMAYQHVEPPTPPQDLLAQIRARAVHTPQLPPFAPETQPAQSVATPSPQPSWIGLFLSRRREQKLSNVVLKHQNYRGNYRDHYVQFMDIALYQMRASFIDTALRLL